MAILKAFWKFLMDIFEIFVMAAAMFVLMYLFLFQVHQVIGDSMIPNFHDKELVLTDKISYKLFTKPQRGDVIIFKYPKNPEFEYIKRIVGLPGEKIRVENGGLEICNAEHPECFFLSEPYIPKNDTLLPKGFIGKTYVEIPANDYVVIGDNRPVSSDSREWGFVPYKNIVGRAFIRYWPLDKTTLIRRITYQ